MSNDQAFSAAADHPLQGCRVAVPESRQLEVLIGLLERRGATVWQCPLVSIHDARDPQPVVDWLQRYMADPFDWLILLTGEGLRRLLAQASRMNQAEEFRAALAGTRTLTRGPKPAKALRELDLRPHRQAEVPTTPGIIAMLPELTLSGQQVGLQLYGEEPNRPLHEALQAQGATVWPVMPYRYADASEDARVSDMIRMMVAGELDVLCLTSSPQLGRLKSVARAHDLEVAWREAMCRMTIVAVGPVVADAVRAEGLPVHLMPENSWFMKPMVQALVDHWTTRTTGHSPAN
ncbi:MAG: uroporphyrinogen-III synthase [Oceanococcaceae bacterium]